MHPVAVIRFLCRNRFHIFYVNNANFEISHKHTDKTGSSDNFTSCNMCECVWAAIVVHLFGCDRSCNWTTYLDISISNAWVHSNSDGLFSMQRQYSLIKRHYRNESTQIYRRCSTIWRLWQVQFVRWIQIQCTAHIHNAISTYFKLMLNAIAQKINEFDVRKKNRIHMSVGVNRSEVRAHGGDMWVENTTEYK